MQAPVLCSGLWLFLIVGPGLTLSCDWDNSIDPAQGLDPLILESGALDTGKDGPYRDLDESACRRECCQSTCDLIVLSEEEGKSWCMLVRCFIHDRDVCVLQPSNRTRVYRKARKQAPKDLGKPHIAPLMGAVDPLSPRSTEQSVKASTESALDQTTESCRAELKVGPCRAALPRWYFNQKEGLCQKFTYGGCRGNANNYQTMESCQAACTGVSSAVKAATEINLDQTTAHCGLTPDPGPCRAAFPMFYYDPNTSTCQSFIYGGCHGNDNRYGSPEECMDQCSGDGVSAGRGKPRNHWTTALFLFVGVACVSALLLGTLVIVSLRRHRLPRRSPSVSDKEELLPEDSQSVSNRT